MDVLLLGTGSADGWPNAFCECASCTWARRTGALRVTTSALVDDVLLLDCGPHTASQAQRVGADLTSVRHLFLTHDHPDHSSPMVLLSRAWARRAEPLHVHGPDDALQRWRQWVGPDDPVQWHPVVAGDEVDADGYRVRVLGAQHEPGSVLYDVTAPDGSRLLYATDTGPLPSSTLDACAAADFDIVLLEETFGLRSAPSGVVAPDHLDLASFGQQVDRLRDVGAVDDGTDVVAVHLSHHNPPEPELTRALAGLGARAVADGTRLVAGAPDQRRVLVTGGARSGKSQHAEALAAAYRRVTYVAPGYPPDGDDPDWAARVATHRARRPAHWTTVESADVPGVLRSAEHAVLLDCVGTWLTRVLDDCGAWDGHDGWQERVDRAVDDLSAAFRHAAVPVIAVTNEVGSGVHPPTVGGSRLPGRARHGQRAPGRRRGRRPAPRGRAGAAPVTSSGSSGSWRPCHPHPPRRLVASGGDTRACLARCDQSARGGGWPSAR